MKFQGMLEDVDTRAHPSYKDMDELDFQILLTDNYFVNLSNIHLCFPMKTKESSDEATDIDDELITVKNFFAHLIKEISVTKYGSDKEFIPAFSPYGIYQYSDSMLKHLPNDTLKSLKKHYLTGNKVYVSTLQILIEESMMDSVLILLVYLQLK